MWTRRIAFAMPLMIIALDSPGCTSRVAVDDEMCCQCQPPPNRPSLETSWVVALTTRRILVSPMRMHAGVCVCVCLCVGVSALVQVGVCPWVFVAWVSVPGWMFVRVGVGACVVCVCLVCVRVCVDVCVYWRRCLCCCVSAFCLLVSVC